MSRSGSNQNVSHSSRDAERVLIEKVGKGNTGG